MREDLEDLNVPIFDPTLMSTAGLREYYNKVENVQVESHYDKAFYTKLGQVIAEELTYRDTNGDRDRTAS